MGCDVSISRCVCVSVCVGGEGRTATGKTVSVVVFSFFPV